MMSPKRVVAWFLVLSTTALAGSRPQTDTQALLELSSRLAQEWVLGRGPAYQALLSDTSLAARQLRQDSNSDLM